jgi:hypothetical protein
MNSFKTTCKPLAPLKAPVVEKKAPVVREKKTKETADTNAKSTPADLTQKPELTAAIFKQLTQAPAKATPAKKKEASKEV